MKVAIVQMHLRCETLHILKHFRKTIENYSSSSILFYRRYEKERLERNPLHEFYFETNIAFF